MKKNKYIEFEDGSAVLKKERKIGTKELIVSVILAFLLFICLLVFESAFLSKYEKTSVVTAKCEVPRSIQITEDNVDMYFEEKNIPVDLVPQSVVSDRSDLINKVVSVNMNQGEIVVQERFSDQEKYLSDMVQPMEIGVSVSDASQAAGGTIRKGDLVNVYAVDTASKQSMEILHEAYVCRAFNQEGTEIRDAGVDEQCLNLGLYIDVTNEQFVSEKLANSTIFISKVIDCGER